MNFPTWKATKLVGHRGHYSGLNDWKDNTQIMLSITKCVVL